jgi:threonyl-tRNA synthetase
MTTVQFDFNLPERFDMTFVDQDGKEKRPYMVHRALLGSIERFFGVLVEHYAGAFPVWLSPIQVRVIPVAPAFNDYADQVRARLKREGFRVDADISEHRMNAKIRTAQNEKIPYMLIVGEKEQEADSVSLRRRKGKEQEVMETGEFIRFMQEKIDSKEEL